MSKDSKIWKNFRFTLPTRDYILVDDILLVLSEEPDMEDSKILSLKVTIIQRLNLSLDLANLLFWCKQKKQFL